MEEPIKPDNPIDIFPNLSPPKPHESEEELKKECIKLIGKEFWENHFKPALAATRYIETSIPHAPRNLPDLAKNAPCSITRGWIGLKSVI